jgi:hypothetical protein
LENPRWERRALAHSSRGARQRNAEPRPVTLPRFKPAFLRRLVWLALLLAAGSYLALAIAEQGAQPAGLAAPPSNPLPFARERVFGLDLRQHASVDALQWLNASGNPPLALIALGVDPDVVAALSQTDQQPLAYSALDLLLSATGTTPVALCLHEPPGTVGPLGVAQAAVGALSERYTERVAYVQGCPSDSVAWRRAVAQATLKADAPPSGLDDAYVPTATGATLDTQAVHDTNIQRAAISVSGGARYVALTIAPLDSVSSRLVQRAEQALRDNSQLALVLVAPGAGADPRSFAGALAGASLGADAAPQGFSGVTAPTLRFDGNWQATVVGVQPYRRATGEGASLTVDFVGSDLYLDALLAPEGGDLSVWLDPPDGPLPAPFSTVTLDATQARDAAVPVVTGLPATRHRVVLASAGGDVTISGVVVSGRASPSWANGVAAAGLLVTSIAALAAICYWAMLNVRRHAGRPPGPRTEGHPRGFALRR